MPTYCYRTKDGEVHELIMTISAMEERQAAGMIRTGLDMTILMDDGRRASRDMGAEHATGPVPGAWPKLCDASGVHPDQIPEAIQKAKRHGIDMEFHPDGRAKYTSRKHRKDYLRSIGLFDRSAGYGDPAPMGVIDREEGDVGA